jgi:hypothetical protein
VTHAIRYARSGDLFIAHTVEGGGPTNLVMTTGHFLHLEVAREWPPYDRFMNRHTGECERIGDDVGGIAVHIGARAAATAAPGEVLVSSTVRDLVTGSGLRFADRGAHQLRGVPGDWRLFSVGPVPA